MLTSWEQLLKLLWPTDITASGLVEKVQVRQFKGSTYLLSYQDHQTQNLIKTNKYQGSRTAARQLAQVLDVYLTSLTEPYSIIPMPISSPRWRERGYNHIELILSFSSHRNQAISNFLYKQIHTKQQTHVSRMSRISQQINTFGCKKQPHIKPNSTIILLDDVITTGGTMQAAQTTLMEHLPPNSTIIPLALAH